jgi:hypothetical protein
MQNRWFLNSALVAILMGLCACGGDNIGYFDEVEYRGQKIKLSRPYSDYDDYKNDPNNISESETARVQKLVMEAPTAKLLDTRIEIFQETGKIVFPGYGSGGVPGKMADGSELIVVSVEIPRAEKERYLLFHGESGHYLLVDDFIHSETPLPLGVYEESGSFVFLDQNGHELFRHSPKAAATSSPELH